MNSQTDNANEGYLVADNEVSGVKKMNKNALIIGVLFIGFVLLIIMWGASRQGVKPQGAAAQNQNVNTEGVAVPAKQPSNINDNAVEGVIPQAPVGVVPPKLTSQPTAPVVIPDAQGNVQPILAGASEAEEAMAKQHREAMANMRNEVEIERQRYYLERILEEQKTADTDMKIAKDSQMSVTLNIAQGTGTTPNLGGLSAGNLVANGLPTTPAALQSAIGGVNPTQAFAGLTGPALGAGQAGLTSGIGEGNVPSSVSAQAALLSQLGGGGSGPDSDVNGQSDKRAFLEASNDSEDYLDRTILEPKSPYEIKQGTIVPGAMVTGINSDLPGRIIGQVSQNVYDTSSGAHLLIPQGTRIFGRYDSSITFGQSRALIVWNRLVFPNGKSINLDSMAGIDQAGYAGLKDKTNRHLFSFYGQAILLSAVGAGIDLLAGDTSNTGGFINDEFDREERLQNAIRDEFSQNLREVTGRVLNRNLDRQPTIIIRPGKPFAILVDQDLVLEPYQQ